MKFSRVGDLTPDHLAMHAEVGSENRDLLMQGMPDSVDYNVKQFYSDERMETTVNDAVGAMAYGATYTMEGITTAQHVLRKGVGPRLNEPHPGIWMQHTGNVCNPPAGRQLSRCHCRS